MYIYFYYGVTRCIYAHIDIHDTISYQTIIYIQFRLWSKLEYIYIYKTVKGQTDIYVLQLRGKHIHVYIIRLCSKQMYMHILIDYGAERQKITLMGKQIYIMPLWGKQTHIALDHGANRKSEYTKWSFSLRQPLNFMAFACSVEFLILLG